MTDESSPELRARSVEFVDRRFPAGSVAYLSVILRDGRVIQVPLWWYPKLFFASPAQRECWRLIAEGRGISWSEIDEDLSVHGLMSEVSTPSPVPRDLLGHLSRDDVHEHEEAEMKTPGRLAPGRGSHAPACSPEGSVEQDGAPAPDLSSDVQTAEQHALWELGCTIGMDDYQPKEWFTLERLREHIFWLETRAGTTVELKLFSALGWEQNEHSLQDALNEIVRLRELDPGGCKG